MSNRRLQTRRSSIRGSSIALVLVFTAAIGIVIAAALQRAATEIRLNKSAILHNEARLAAESAIQHGMAQVRQRFERTQQLMKDDMHPSNNPLVLGPEFTAFHSTDRVDSHLVLPTGTYDATKFATYPTAVLGQVTNQNAISALVDPMSPIPDQNSAVIDAKVREVRLYAKATVSHPSLGERTSYVKKTFQVLDLSLFQYAVFYNHDMELWPGANMNLAEGGPIHVNGDAYIGANATLNIHSRITTSGDFFAGRHPKYSTENLTTDNIYLRNLNAGNVPASYLKRLSDADNGANSPSKYLTSKTKNFSDLASEHYNGGLMTKEHNIDHVHPAGLGAFTELFPPGSGETGNHAHNLIRPVENEDVLTDPSLTSQQRQVIQTIEEVKWANKAKLTLELDVSGGTPTLDIYTYEYDSDKIEYNLDYTPKKVAITVPAGNEFWQIEEYSKPASDVVSGIYDYRQGGNQGGKTAGKINLVKIDVEKMREWVESGDSAVFDPDWWNGVVYLKMPEVADPGRQDRVIPADNDWAAQLVKGKQIPNRISSGIRGMTLATNGALYVTGDYNAPEGGTSPSNNPSPANFGKEGYEAPAALIADAITILSNNWQNKNSDKAIGSRTASDTIVSAALVTGLVPSNGYYSGGVENFPRFLESWSNKTLTYRGSLVSLFKSESQTAKWPGTGTTYGAPNRNWGFHKGFIDLPPPGDPGGRVYRQISFAELTPSEFQMETAAVLAGSTP